MDCDDINFRHLNKYFVMLRTTHALQIVGGARPPRPRLNPPLIPIILLVKVCHDKWSVINKKNSDTIIIDLLETIKLYVLYS